MGVLIHRQEKDVDCKDKGSKELFKRLHLKCTILEFIKNKTKPTQNDPLFLFILPLVLSPWKCIFGGNNVFFLFCTLQVTLPSPAHLSCSPGSSLFLNPHSTAQTAGNSPAGHSVSSGKLPPTLPLDFQKSNWGSNRSTVGIHQINYHHRMFSAGRDPQGSSTPASGLRTVNKTS